MAMICDGSQGDVGFWWHGMANGMANGMAMFASPNLPTPTLDNRPSARSIKPVLLRTIRQRENKVEHQSC